MDYRNLETVKAMMGITGTYQDTAVKGYVQEVIHYMIGAGVSEELAHSEIAVGVVTRGVSDLWDYGSGNTSLSPYFKERVTQLCYEGNKEDIDKPIIQESCVEEITDEEISEIIDMVTKEERRK